MEKQALLVALFVGGILLAEAARLFGRTLFGLLAGLRLSHLTIGAGPLLFRRRIGTAVVMLRAVPLIAGQDWMPPETPTRMRARFWLLTAGGSLGCVAAIALLGAFGVHWTGTPPQLWAWQAVLTGIFVQLFARLIPFSSTSDGQKVPSDGLQLWTIPRMDQASIDAAFVRSYLAAASDEILHGDPKRALDYCERGIACCAPVDARVFRYSQAAAYGRLGDHAKAKECVAYSLAAAVPQPLQGVALNDWSWYAFCERDEADLRLADRRSAEALGARPKSSAVLGTRGAVLLWRGRVTQAIPMLERSLQRAPTARSRSTEAALLAMAHASRGESVRAQEMFDRARRLDPDQRLLGEARRYVQAAASSLRLLCAARGSRALLVEPDGIELLEGVAAVGIDDPVGLKAAARGRRRLTLSEIDQVTVGGARSGRHHLIVRHDQSVWRLPVAVGDLTWARMLADDVMNHPPLRETVPPVAPLQSERVTKWLPAIGIAAMAAIMLGVPAARSLVGVTMMSAFVAILLRPGVASALALGTTAVIWAVPWPYWHRGWHVHLFGDAGIAGKGMLLGVAVVSVAGAWFAAREGRARDGVRFTVGLLVATLILDVALAAALFLVGRSFDPSELVCAVAALVAVLAWSRLRARRGS
jgi:tetratricopeptide (TPR) repeat protein